MLEVLTKIFGSAGWIGLVAVFFLTGCGDKKVAVAEEHTIDLLAAVMSYHAEFGEYPTGSDLEISQKLRGENPTRKVFAALGSVFVSEEGGFVDPWGRAYRFAVLPNKDLFHVYSLGPNRLPDGVDDIGEITRSKKR